MSKPDSIIRLTEEEWNFSTIPDHEQSACLAWEAAREWSEVIPRIRTLEKLPDDSIYKNGSSEWGSISNINLAPMLVGKSKLLIHPWKRLPQKVRSECLGFIEHVFYEIEPDDINTEAFHSDATKRFRGMSWNMVAFEINWGASDTRLVNEFSRWLAENRQAKPIEKRGSGPADHLNMLGAMRLMHHYSVEDASALTALALGKPLYGKRPSWERARRGATEVIAEILLYDSETENWDLFCDELKSYPRFKKQAAGK